MKKLYKTPDFNLASVLSYFGPYLVSIEKFNGKVIWCFQETEELEKLVSDYSRGVLEVNVVEFLSKQKLIKSTIYNS